MATVQRASMIQYPDGQVVIHNIRKKRVSIPVFGANETYSATLVNTWYDGTAMDDSKADGSIYFKLKALPSGADSSLEQYVGSYFKLNLPNEGELFLEKDAMQEMRDLSSTEILLLQMGYYKGVKLNGYYEKGDTPNPIEYALSDTVESDDGGSVIEVGGLKLGHFFGDEQVSVKYFGVKNTNAGLDNTNRINSCLKACRNVLVDEDLSIEVDETIKYTELTLDLRNVIVVPSFTDLTINGKIKFINNDSAYHAVLSINDVTNVNILGTGSIEGTYLTTPSIASGSGHGISLYDAEYVNISGLKLFHFQGDGIYILGRRRDESDLLCRHINIFDNNLEGNSRQGISIIKGEHISIRNNVISKTGVLAGTVLGCGIDMEPEWHRTISHIDISNNRFEDNYSNPINMLILVTTTAEIKNISILNNNIVQGGEGGACYAINARKNSPDLDGVINSLTIAGNTITLNNVRAQRGISLSNRVDNVIIKDNTITKTYSELPVEPSADLVFRGISLASAKDVIISDNKITGNFRYSIYGESNYTTNVTIRGNVLDGALTHLNARQLSLLYIEDNKLLNGTEGINMASITTLKIKGNYIGNFDSFGVGLATNVINAEVSKNTLEDCCKLTGGDTGETEINRSWIGVYSSVPASPSKYVVVENNFFIRDENVTLFRHISASNNVTRYLDIRGNLSREEDVVVFNNSVTGDIKSPHRSFGITAQKPTSLPEFSSGYFFDTTTNKLSYWTGSDWVEINGDASQTTKGVVNMAATVVGITLPDVSNLSASEVSEVVTYINNNIVPIINNLKLTVNQSLNTEKASGQRAST